MELNEEQQTEAVFKSMRNEVDPVSGNEVPPGSLPEEVRDDIPAMLSEGEYIVPADVLRFYGMKFFEDLRNEAKRGLADMESNGRIGGEPVEGPAMSGGEELTPEERAEIESMVMMAVGGYVPNPADMQQQPDPYTQQQAMYNVGKPVAVGNTGFAEGGTVPDDTQVSTADYATRFAPGFNFLEGSNASEFSIVTLYGPSGEVVTLTLPTDEARYEDLLQAGYSTDPAGGEATGVTTETTVGKEDSEGREGGGPDGGPNGGDDTTTQGPSLSEMSNDQLAASAKAIGIMGKVGAVALGPLGTAALGTVAAARYNDILDEMNVRGLDTTGMSRKGSVFGGEESLLGGLNDTNNDGTVNFGDTFVGDLLGFDGKFGVQGKGLKDSWSGGRRGSTTNSTTGVTAATVAADAAAQSGSRGVSRGGGDGPSGGGGSSAAGVSGPAAGASVGGNAPGVSAGPSGASAGAASSAAAGSGHEGNADPSAGGSMLKKGGLVQRPTKKKKK